MDKNYFLIIRTGESEIKAIQESKSEIFDKTFPIIELTRGRKKTIGESVTYPYNKRLKDLQESLRGKDVGFDITGEPALSSDEISLLFNPDNGYRNWIDFLHDLKTEEIFKSITPTIIYNFEDNNFEENLKIQISALEEISNRIIYRSSLDDDEFCYDDLSFLCPILKKETELIILIDCGYIPQAMQRNVSEKCVARISNIRKMVKDKRLTIGICGTSFPNNVADLGDVDHDTFSNAEVLVYNDCLLRTKDIIYGDYGSINPIRNDTVTMARGWIPRIDIPLKEETFYYKKRRPSGITAYASTYKDVANIIIKDKRFPHIDWNWGLQQVMYCTKTAPSSRPGFWMSVRMCIHIEQQYLRINEHE